MGFISDFIAATDIGLSPPIFRKWAAYSAVSAALNRNVSTALREGMPLWPNLYTLLVGGPASGKSIAISAARALADTQPEINLSADHMTHEAFIRKLSQLQDASFVGSEMRTKSTMALFLSEWGTFLEEPEPRTCAMLAAIFDCRDYENETIGRGVDSVEQTYVNILGGATPAWFATGFPPNTYEQGLPTRFFFIFSDAVMEKKSFVVDPLAQDEEWSELRKAFTKRMDAMSRCKGFCGWTDDALLALNDWYNGDCEPAPKNPMLSGYCKRRPLLLGKLAVLQAVSSHPERLVVDKIDLDNALADMVEAEKDMARALSAAGGNIYKLRQLRIAEFVLDEHLRTKKPVPEWLVRQRLSDLVPPNMLRTILDEMLASQQLRMVEGTVAPTRKLMPGVGVK